MVGGGGGGGGGGVRGGFLSPRPAPEAGGDRPAKRRRKGGQRLSPYFPRGGGALGGDSPLHGGASPDFPGPPHGPGFFLTPPPASLLAGRPAFAGFSLRKPRACGPGEPRDRSRRRADERCGRRSCSRAADRTTRRGARRRARGSVAIIVRANIAPMIPRPSRKGEKFYFRWKCRSMSRCLMSTMIGRPCGQA